MSNTKVCFVIAPIGDPDSDTRKKSDDVYDLIIEPALEKFDFEAIRADKIASTGVISEDILGHIQTADLCIIDLTGHNANVFYECGRRHQTEKPYIQIKRKGETLPFDVAGIRTIDYDLSDPRKVKETQDVLKNFIGEMVNTGFSEPGVSLQTIMSSLDRIERKVSSLSKTKIQPQTPGYGKDNYDTDNPVQLFFSALDGGNYPLAAQALKRYMTITTNYDLLLDMATMIIEKYDASGVEIAKHIMDNYFDDITPGMISAACFALYDLYRVALTLENEKEYIINTVNQTLQRSNVSPKDRARLINVLASIEWSLKNYYEAITLQKQTIELMADESVYYYNLTTLYEIVNNIPGMFETLEKLIDLHRSEDYTKHYIKGLEYAEEVYIKYSKPQTKIDEIRNLIEKYRFKEQEAATRKDSPVSDFSKK